MKMSIKPRTAPVPVKVRYQVEEVGGESGVAEFTLHMKPLSQSEIDQFDQRVRTLEVEARRADDATDIQTTLRKELAELIVGFGGGFDDGTEYSTGAAMSLMELPMMHQAVYTSWKRTLQERIPKN